MLKQSVLLCLIIKNSSELSGCGEYRLICRTHKTRNCQKVDRSINNVFAKTKMSKNVSNSVPRKRSRSFREMYLQSILAVGIGIQAKLTRRLVWKSMCLVSATNV